MALFLGTLNSNAIFPTLYNFVVSHLTFARNIAKHQTQLVDLSRREGSLFGDKLLYTMTDILGSRDWLNDAEAPKLLELERPPLPVTQEIVLDQFRQIGLTVDNYLTKQAWEDEGSFGQFISVMTGWINETQKIHEAKTFNSFIGTHKADGVLQNRTVALPSDDNAEAENRLQAQTIARDLADLYVELEDASRDFNDNGDYRSYDREDMVVVWSAPYANKITKVDTSTIFHKDGMFDPFKYVLSAKFFGETITEDGTIPSGSANLTIRSLVEKDYNTVKRNHPDYVKSLHIFPGDLIPAGQSYKAYEAYTEDNTVMYKMYHKDAVPFMSSFRVGTSFYNERSLTRNDYLTWGYNTLDHLINYPFITVKAAQA